MGKIRLLDCTLRDGGYINDWRFGKAAIKDIKERIETTGVDVVELGFMRNEPYQPDRVVFNSMDQVKALIGRKVPGLLYTVMCEIANPMPLELISPAEPDGPEVIRVIVWKTKRGDDGVFRDALEEGFAYCKGIVEKGYKLCVQPARVDQYSDEEFVSMVRRFSTIDPMAIYVVDSWGTQNAEGLLHYMHLADENMPPQITLGYHGHNNMMQALAVAQAMLREGFSRDVMIDASVYGIGRGAGNLNLEIIAKYLNEQWGKRYDLFPMLQVYEDHIKAIYEMEAWGYSIPYFLTAKYNCNPNYARVFSSTGKGTAEFFRSILQGLSDEERVIYRKEILENALAEMKY